MQALTLDTTTERFVGAQIPGTPETCIRRIRELEALFGTDHVVGIFRDGGMPIARARKSIERFVAEVVPAVRDDTETPAYDGAHMQRGGS